MNIQHSTNMSSKAEVFEVIQSSENENHFKANYLNEGDVLKFGKQVVVMSLVNIPGTTLSKTRQQEQKDIEVGEMASMNMTLKSQMDKT